LLSAVFLHVIFRNFSGFFQSISPYIRKSPAGWWSGGNKPLLFF
jgi:hypothetical protein